MNKLSVSWDLVKTSFGILREDKELIVFPLISSLVSLTAMAAIFGGYFGAYWPEIQASHAAGPSRQMPHQLALYGLTFLFPIQLRFTAWYGWLVYFVSILASAAVQPPMFIGFSLLAGNEREPDSALP